MAPALFPQALDGYLTRLEQSAAEALSGPDDDALERLHLFLLASVHGVPLGPDLPPAEEHAAAVCLADKMALELGVTDPEVAHRVNAGFGVIEASPATCVRAAQRSGDLDPNADPDELACLIFTITRGIDVIGATGRSLSCLTSIAESAFACLPVTNTNAHNKHRDRSPRELDRNRA